MEHYEDASNSESLRADLDLIEEARERAAIQMASYCRKVARYHNRKVRSKYFNLGDLVLRKAEVSQPTEHRKLSPNWEGPYQVRGIIRPGTYQLARPDGALLP